MHTHTSKPNLNRNPNRNLKQIGEAEATTPIQTQIEPQCIRFNVYRNLHAIGEEEEVSVHYEC